MRSTPSSRSIWRFAGSGRARWEKISRRTIEDIRFLADHKCIGLEVDTLPRNWATQGVQYYLLAPLAYDPYQDGNALLKDYYRREFGPAAAEIEQYFALMEQAHEEILKRIVHSGGKAREMIGVCQEVYTPDLLFQAEQAIRRAEARSAAGPDLFRRRVAFIRTGFDYVRLQVEIISTMKIVRESRGKAVDAVRKAVDLCAMREKMLKENPPYAVSEAQWYHQARKLDDWMGPPSEELREPGYAGPDAVPDARGQD